MLGNKGRMALVLIIVNGLCGALKADEGAGANTARVIVGPNILVSRDGDVAHVELMVATSPKDPKRLVGGAIIGRPGGGWACKTYASTDGGYTWFDAIFPEQVEFGGADPQVAFTADGTGLFAALGSVRDEHGGMREGVLVYRSEDGGHTWGKPVLATVGGDHPQITVDHTGGRHNGRVYIGYLHTQRQHGAGPNIEYQISVVRSDDGGRTFTEPVLAVSGKGVIGINVTSVHVLSDGTVMVPYADFDFHQTSQPRTEATSNLCIVASSDGGDTYSQAAKVATQYRKLQPALGGFPMYAADVSPGPYRDRIYGAWVDYHSGDGRIVFTYSTDKGRTWKEPFHIDPSGPAGSRQYQVMLAVNKDGVVGITWFDTRAAHDLAHYDEYFAASTDGGATFLKSVRISSRTSEMFGIGNMQIIPEAWHYQAFARVSFISPATRWRAGGDYMGLAADSTGVFHPFWADSRSGTFQIWTARVEVSKQPKPSRIAPADVRVEDMTQQIDIVTDPARYNPASHELEMPLRLKNLSDKRLYGPITVSAWKFGSGLGEVLGDYAPEVLNAANGKKGPGAAFDYTSALGDSHVLEPGALTDAVVWRLRISAPERIPDMHLTVTAGVEKTAKATRPDGP